MSRVDPYYQGVYEPSWQYAPHWQVYPSQHICPCGIVTYYYSDNTAGFPSIKPDEVSMDYEEHLKAAGIIE